MPPTAAYTNARELSKAILFSEFSIRGAESFVATIHRHSPANASNINAACAAELKTKPNHLAIAKRKSLAERLVKSSLSVKLSRQMNVEARLRTRTSPNPALRRVCFIDDGQNTCKWRGGSRPRQFFLKSLCPQHELFGVVSTTLPPGFNIRLHSLRSSIGSGTCSMTWFMMTTSNDSVGNHVPGIVPQDTSRPLDFAIPTAFSSKSIPLTVQPRLRIFSNRSPEPQPISNTFPPDCAVKNITSPSIPCLRSGKKNRSFESQRANQFTDSDSYPKALAKCAFFTSRYKSRSRRWPVFSCTAP